MNGNELSWWMLNTNTELICSHISALQPVACRGLVMPGASASLDAPLPNCSIEQWRMVVIVTGYNLFVTSQYDVMFKFVANV